MGVFFLNEPSLILFELLQKIIFQDFPLTSLHCKTRKIWQEVNFHGKIHVSPQPII